MCKGGMCEGGCVSECVKVACVRVCVKVGCVRVCV